MRDNSTTHENSNTDSDSHKQKEIASNNNFSSLDKVDIPYQFLGKTFGFLFECLYESEGVIAISLYRYPRPSNPANSGINKDGLQYNEGIQVMQGVQGGLRYASRGTLPFVIAAPHADTILQMYDEVFVLRARQRPRHLI
jgi:hypothetical protein